MWAGTGSRRPPRFEILLRHPRSAPWAVNLKLCNRTMSDSSSSKILFCPGFPCKQGDRTPYCRAMGRRPTSSRSANAQGTPDPQRPLSSASGAQRIELRKYPNRRYYDTSRSRHLTLEEIRGLVRDGHDVQVTDSATGADITAKVMTQIILELDSPKLELMPPALLAQLIRVNDQLLKSFFGTFFNQASQAFLDYLRTLENQMRSASALPSMFPAMGPWSFAHSPFAPPPGLSSPSPAQAASPDWAARIESLSRELEELRAGKSPGSTRRRARRRRARGGG